MSNCLYVMFVSLKYFIDIFLETVNQLLLKRMINIISLSISILSIFFLKLKYLRLL